jgi:hypothetical protein
MDEKSIALEMGDHRVLDFHRTSKTRFFKKDEEVKSPQFHEGDEILIEGTQDPTGYLTAVNVRWQDTSKAENQNPDKDKKDGVVDTWKDAPPEGKPAGSISKESSAEAVPPPAKADPDDPGPPRLKRGGPADPARQRAAETPASATPAETARATTAPPAEVREAPPAFRPADRDDGAVVTGATPADQFIRRASDAALDFTETLPSYVVQEVITRFQSETRNPSWQAIDVVTTNVVYENGREEYRDIAVNGKATKKSIEESGGAWSTGEFGTVLIDLFSPATAADFRYRHESRIAGGTARVYDFAVPRERSHWAIHSGSQIYNPAYKGSVWIDPQTARVMRIEMQAQGFPEAFPIDHVEAANDYQNIRLGDLKQYLLPVHAENLSCQRGTSYCSKNVIDFRNYHKYAGESTVTFGAPK